MSEKDRSSSDEKQPELVECVCFHQPAKIIPQKNCLLLKKDDVEEEQGTKMRPSPGSAKLQRSSSDEKQPELAEWPCFLQLAKIIPHTKNCLCYLKGWRGWTTRKAEAVTKPSTLPLPPPPTRTTAGEEIERGGRRQSGAMRSEGIIFKILLNSSHEPCYREMNSKYSINLESKVSNTWDHKAVDNKANKGNHNRTCKQIKSYGRNKTRRTSRCTLRNNK